ncbi:MAG: aspartate aminotransferase family protein [Gemmatimonadetes bacterium]|nr:aspartate aminotransferase family protein [Gemmatimonadota bacterium]
MPPAADAKAAIEAAYRARTRRSDALHREAAGLLPGGVARGITHYAPYPTYMEEGCGCRVTDADGNVYLDQLNNYGSMIHGHAHPAVVAALREQVGRGTDWGTPTQRQLVLARMIAERVPSVERIRFTNSGGEAVMYAVRAARAFTGRNRILRMEGSYHGGYDSVVASPGLAESIVAETLVAPYNDLETASRLIEAQRAQLAAVLVEPVSVRGMHAAEPGFLLGLREVTREAGVLLICDEVVTFRLAAGGAQSIFGITPDLTTFGKIIGGGLPVGAFGGRADIMDRFDPTRPDSAQHSGTFAGNAATMAAGIAALGLLTPAEIARINGLGDRLRSGIKGALDEAGVLARVTGLGSLVGIHLAERAGMHWLHLATLNHGLFMRAEGAFFLSTAMRDDEVAETVSTFRVALADTKPILHTGSPS